MTAAYRLKGLGWFAGCAIVTLGFYLVSLQVAAERKHLSQVNERIRAAERDIRALETEFDTRANLAQLERWNGDTLALVAPSASQFVRDEGALAAIRFDMGMQNAAIRTAALVVPSLPSFVPPPAPAAMAAVVTVPTPASAPVPHTAPASRAIASDPTVVIATRAVPPTRPATPPAKPAQALRKAQAMAMLDQTLLSDSTLGDLMSGARAESGRRR